MIERPPNLRHCKMGRGDGFGRIAPAINHQHPQVAAMASYAERPVDGFGDRASDVVPNRMNSHSASGSEVDARRTRIMCHVRIPVPSAPRERAKNSLAGCESSLLPSGSTFKSAIRVDDRLTIIIYAGSIFEHRIAPA